MDAQPYKHVSVKVQQVCFGTLEQAVCVHHTWVQVTVLMSMTLR